MTDASTEAYDVEGHKISLKAIVDFSSLLPPEASEIVQRTQDVFTILQVRTSSISCQILRLNHILGHPKQS